MNFIYVTHLLIALDLLDELYLCHQVAEQGRALRNHPSAGLWSTNIAPPRAKARWLVANQHRPQTGPKRLMGPHVSHVLDM